LVVESRGRRFYKLQVYCNNTVAWPIRWTQIGAYTHSETWLTAGAWLRCRILGHQAERILLGKNCAPIGASQCGQPAIWTSAPGIPWTFIWCSGLPALMRASPLLPCNLQEARVLHPISCFHRLVCCSAAQPKHKGLLLAGDHHASKTKTLH